MINNRISADKAILVVSFGTSYQKTRELTIEAIEKKIEDSFLDYLVKRAFTSSMVIVKLKKRDGIEIDNVDQALERLTADGVRHVVVQPTHIVSGLEYDKMMRSVEQYRGSFETVKTGRTLLSSDEDYFEAVKSIMREVTQDELDGSALVFMGHGTEHAANESYRRINKVFRELGYGNVFVGTVEGDTDPEQLARTIAAAGYRQAVLLPLMIVAGDHILNDMAGDGEGSWKSIFTKAGLEVRCVIKGLGQYEGIRDMYVEHVRAAIKE